MYELLYSLAFRKVLLAIEYVFKPKISLGLGGYELRGRASEELRPKQFFIYDAPVEELMMRLRFTSI